MIPRTYFEVFIGIITLASAVLASPVELRAENVDFAKDIRPILSHNCFKCHGPDDDARQAELRLDTREGLFQDLGGYSVVQPRSPAESELVKRILSQDESEVMPPPESNKSLSATEKQLLQDWIAQGAVWKQHWAFVPPRKPAIPHPPGDEWCQNEIDHFVLNRLNKSGLSPSGSATPFTLVRRLYLDLIGLPPTPEEADLWVARIWSSPDSSEVNEPEYQSLISHLLQSPHYGERWARRWLDLARYADSNGYEKDRDRSIWPYRDWVIGVLNADMPFDQFTIEQLAGDMLPSPTQEQRIATGFHRNTMLNEEGGIDPLEFRFRAMTDRVATTGTTWLGLTLGCCQCHTHKYDPLSHTEYFQLMAFLNNTDEPQLELPGRDFNDSWNKNLAEAEKLIAELASQWSPVQSVGTPNPASEKESGQTDSDQTDSDQTDSDQTDSDQTDSDQTDSDQTDSDQTDSDQTDSDEADSDEADADEADSELDASEKERSAAMRAAFAEWLQAERANAVAWWSLKPIEATSTLPILTILNDDSVFASGDTEKRDDYFLTFAASDRPITAIQLEALPDERLPARGPGSTYYEGTLGDFYLTEFKASVAGDDVRFASATESYAKNRFGKNPVSAQLALDGDVQTGWSVDGRQGQRHVAVFLLNEKIPAGKQLSIHMTFGRHFASSLGHFRLRATSADSAPAARDYSETIEALLVKPAELLTESEENQLLEQFLLSSPQLAGQSERIRKLQARPEVPHTLVMSEWPDEHRRTTHRHHRGEFLLAREVVSPATPRILHPLSSDLPRDRLGFARWLASPENPLIARVVVNRAWSAFFGTGLVKTEDDFGFQGEAPSHPELLDWLALQFMHEYGWSLKELHRAIVSSSTYRQSTKLNVVAASVDPANRLLSYSPRFRLEAEIIRDTLLVAAGKLSPKMGGPPVRPPQPEGVTEVAYGSPKWQVSEGEDRYRRSIYTFVKRTAPFAMLATFDAPSGEACVAQRTRSNSPLQALTLLNDVMAIELARAAGDRVMRSDPSSSNTEKLTQLFRSVLTRPPGSDELETLNSYFESQLAAFSAQPEQAERFLDADEPKHSQASGESSAPQSQEQVVQRAAWAATARALFALDEAQTRE